MDHLLTPCKRSVGNSLGNVDYSWFTSSSYLKDDNGKYCAEYAIATSLDIVEAVPLSMATSA